MSDCSVRPASMARPTSSLKSFRFSPIDQSDPCRSVVRASGDLPNAQRLGYLLERVRGRPQAKALHEWLGRQSPHVVPLRPGRNANGALEDQRWHVRVTEPIEIET